MNARSLYFSRFISYIHLHLAILRLTMACASKLRGWEGGDELEEPSEKKSNEGRERNSAWQPLGVRARIGKEGLRCKKEKKEPAANQPRRTR